MGKYQKNIEAARRITVMQYLETYHPGELVRKTDREYCTRTHDSLIITPANGFFHWFSHNVGGNNAIDYLQIAYFAMDKMYLAYLVGNGINPVQLGADAVGNTMRLDNCLHNLPQSVTDLESKLVQLQKQLENAKEQLAQPFAQADELAEKSKRLAELEALLNLNEKDIVLDTVPDEDQQCRSDNRQRGQER